MFSETPGLMLAQNFGPSRTTVLTNSIACFTKHQVFYPTIPPLSGQAGPDVRPYKRKREGEHSDSNRSHPGLSSLNSASLPGAQDVEYFFPGRAYNLEEFGAYNHAGQNALQGAAPGMFRPPGKHC